MKRLALVVVLSFALLTTAIHAASPPLQLKVEVTGPHVILGGPVTVTVSLRGEGDFQLARSFGPCDGGLLKIIIVSESGGGDVQMASDIPPCPQVTPPPSEAPPYYPGSLTLGKAESSFIVRSAG